MFLFNDSINVILRGVVINYYSLNLVISIICNILIRNYFNVFFLGFNVAFQRLIDIIVPIQGFKLLTPILCSKIYVYYYILYNIVLSIVLRICNFGFDIILFF